MNIFKKMSQRTKAGIGAIILTISGGLNLAQQNKINELEETVATSKDAQAVQLLDENNEKMKIQIDSLTEENQELQKKIESIFPSEREDKESDELIVINASTDEEVLNELRNLVDLIEEPYVSKNTGDTYCKIKKYTKDNKLLFGLFNITKRIGTQCKYEYLSGEFKSKSGIPYVWADNKNGDQFIGGLLNLETLKEDVPSGTYAQINEEFQSPYNKEWYRWVDNDKEDKAATGLYSIKDKKEVIPTDTYTSFCLDKYGIAECIDKDGNVNIIKLDAPKLEEETTKEETTKEENTKEENTKEETTKEENTKEENTKEENTKEENTKEETTKEENTKEETTKEENTKEETTKEENTKETKPSKKNKNLIKIKGGTEDEILDQLINLFDYVADPYEMPNGDVYRIVGKYKDNKLLYGIFNVTKLKGTQCEYENIKLDSNVGAKHGSIKYTEVYTYGPNENIDVGKLGITNIKPQTSESNNGYLYFEVDNIYGDNYNNGLLNIDTLTEDIPTGTYCYVGEEFQAADGTWYRKVDNKYGDEYSSGLFNMNTLQEDIPTGTYYHVGEEFQAADGTWYRKVDNKYGDEYSSGLFNMNTLQEDIPTGTYYYVGEEFQAADGTWYRKVDNKYGDKYSSGLFNMDTLQEDIPTGTYTNVKNVGNNIYHCTDENGNVTVIKLPRKSR